MIDHSILAKDTLKILLYKHHPGEKQNGKNHHRPDAVYECHARPARGHKC